MHKVSNQSHFIKSFTHLLTGKLTAREVLIYGIVHQFEANNTPCFISRQELAKRINESEATAERSLQLLIKEGYIVARREGRKRYLSTAYPQKPDLYQVDTNQVADLYQNDTQSVSKQGVDLYQPDTLTRSITRSINKINLIKDIKDNKSNNGYTMEWDAEKKAMVRRKAN
jgi:predicted transcriptional regulator